MNYLPRMVEERIRDYFEHFPCVLVVGARQVGKSTLLQHVFSRTAKNFVFDPVQELYGERSDPDLFLRNNPPPLILDEIQYVPQLIPSVKRFVDAANAPGMYLFTGSQQWEVVRKLSESLAGRLVIIELPSFSLEEMHRRPILGWIARWLQGDNEIFDLDAGAPQSMRSAGMSPAETVWRGTFPRVASVRQNLIPGWFQGYVATYLQRDVRNLMNIKDETLFARFLGLCSALSGKECNHSQLGRDIGISTPTAQSWIGLLKATFQWIEIPAYSRNEIKKLSQKPKGYITDTGLACFLQRISSPEALMGHPSFGALFETFCVLEIRKQLQKLPLTPAMYHFRAHSGSEVDLILELDGRYFPLEIKSGSRVTSGDAQGIERFWELVQPKCGVGVVLYTGQTVVRLDEHTVAIPFDSLLETNG